MCAWYYRRTDRMKLHWVFSWLLTNETLCEKGPWLTIVWPSRKLCSLKMLLGKPESGGLRNCGLNWLGVLVRIETRFNTLSTSLIRACITMRYLIQRNYWLWAIDGSLLPRCFPVTDPVMKKLFCNKAVFLCLRWRWDKYLIGADTFTEFLH